MKNERAAMAMVAGVLAITMTGTTLPTALYAGFERQLGLSPMLTPIIFASYVVGVIAALLFLGYLSDEVGRRRMMLPALALSALSAGAFLLAHGLPLLLVGRVLSGLSSGIASGAATAWIVDLAGKQGEQRATLVAVGANLGGLAGGPLLGGVLARYAPWPLMLPFLVHLLLLVLAAGLVLWAPETVVKARPRVKLRMQKLEVPAKVRASFRRAALAGVCAFAVAGVFTAVAPAFLSKGLHHPSPALTGVLVGVFFLGAALGQLPVAKVDKHKGLMLGCAVLVGGLGLLAGSLASESTLLLFLSAAVSGFGQGLCVGFGLADINARTGKNRAETDSTYFVLVYLGVAVPTVGVGMLVAAVGMMVAGLVFCGVVALCVVADLVLMAVGGSPHATSG